MILKVYFLQLFSMLAFFQCCGSGTRCLFTPWIWDPGWVKIRIRDPDPGWTTQIIFPRAYKQFFGLKYLNFLMRRSGSGIRNLFDPGSGIRDKHPGSTTLLFLYFLFCFKIVVSFLRLVYINLNSIFTICSVHFVVSDEGVLLEKICIEFNFQARQPPRSE